MIKEIPFGLILSGAFIAGALGWVGMLSRDLFKALWECIRGRRPAHFPERR